MSNTQVGQLGRLAIRLCAKLRPCSGRSTALSFRWLVKGTGRAENRDARRMEQDLSCDFRKMTVDRRKRGSHVHRSFVAGWSSLVARQAHNLKVVGSNPTPAPNLKPPETAPGGFCLMTCAIFERATVRVQPQSARGNFGTPKPNITPNIFSSRKAGFPHRPSGSAPAGLTVEHQ